jgi:hypothetical protein
LSKEIAQTVGGKRIAWLIAIVAAFAVMATVGTQFRSASADVTAADYCIDEYDGADVADACANDAIADATLGVGDQIVYEVDILPLTQPTLGDLRIIVTLDSDLGSISGITENLGANTSCVAAANVLTCTIEGPLAAATTGTIRFTATITGTGDITSAAITANDLGSAQGAVAGADLTDDVTTISAAGLTKVNSVTDLPQAGGAYTSVITFTNTEAIDVDGTSITITDAIPAGVSVTSVSVGGTAGGAALAAADCGAVLPLAGAATLSCVVNFTAGDFDAGKLSF